MRRFAAVLLAAIAAALILTAAAAAQEPGDSASVALSSLSVGERTILHIGVLAPAGATVEVDPSSESWNGVEVIRVVRLGLTPSGEQAVHRFDVIVAPFVPGPGTFVPAVTVITAEGATVRNLPPVTWNVRATLPEGAPLEISPLAAPSPIDGAESPLLRPAIGLGGLGAAALLAIAIVLAWRTARARIRADGPTFEAGEHAPAGFEAIETLIDSDPVTAYRSLGVIVRGVIARRFELPATALTTSELRSRMEDTGADRFMARLVGGFLEECDSVVYAGYRPAAERRRADLTMAREIVEGAG